MENALATKHQAALTCPLSAAPTPALLSGTISSRLLAKATMAKEHNRSKTQEMPKKKISPDQVN